MSISLARIAAAADRPALEVVLATTAAEVSAVQHLRWQIYVQEMKITRPDDPSVQGERLVDDYDARSHHLLLLADGAPAGSLRLTEARAGQLELEEYASFAEHLESSEGLFEPSRYMVRRDLRRGAAGPLLLVGLYRWLKLTGARRLIAAGKQGNLGRYYQNLGLRKLPAAPFVHGVTGCRYELMLMDFGPRGSLRRGSLELLVLMITLLIFRLQPIWRRYIRRGFDGSTAARDRREPTAPRRI